MEESPRVFHGKLMLFGEYGVVLQGRALTIPLFNFSASLKFPGVGISKNNLLNQQLKGYHQALVHEQATMGFHLNMDLGAFAHDLSMGMFMESDIPQGYGAGSSGALVAAVFHRYSCSPQAFHQNPTPNQLRFLQKSLARLESNLHGTSSGIDPLSCYVAKPLLINTKGYPEIVCLKKWEANSPGGFFLIDTLMSRKTEKLVKLFRQKCLMAPFNDMLEKEYLPVVDQCINYLLAADLTSMLKSMKKLSEIQLIHFSQMIPERFMSLWQQWLDNEWFAMKLCGAGGGGFLLGYTANYQQIDKYLHKMGAGIIPVVFPS